MPRVLASDLDGTLIPLDNDADHRRDLSALVEQLELRKMALVFVTGRHLASVRDAVQRFGLPEPEWIISDVGTTISRSWVPDEDYARHLDGRLRDYPIKRLKNALATQSGLRLQEEEKQGRFKLSFYVEADELQAHTDQIERMLQQHGAPYAVIASVDPFNGDGLIDLLPVGVSKAYAIAWWVRQQNLQSDDIIFAGDSGNDFAALTAGYRSIVVANADRGLVERVRQSHAVQGWHQRLHVAKRTATSGVLEGLNWFVKSESA